MIVKCGEQFSSGPKFVRIFLDADIPNALRENQNEV